MLYKQETENGSISIDKAVIGKIITEIVDKLHGKVLVSNHKGKISGFVSKLGVIDEINNMEINLGKKGLDIKLYIVIRFGTSINMITDHLIQNIKRDIEEYTSIEANSIAVVVTGMFSKQVVRRNIEVRG